MARNDNGALLLLAALAAVVMFAEQEEKKPTPAPEPIEKGRPPRERVPMPLPQKPKKRKLIGAATEIYKGRRDKFVQEKAGLSDEEMAALQETGLLDTTDTNLLTVSLAEKALGSFGLG